MKVVVSVAARHYACSFFLNYEIYEKYQFRKAFITSCHIKVKVFCSVKCVGGSGNCIGYRVIGGQSHYCAVLPGHDTDHITNKSGKGNYTMNMKNLNTMNIHT